MKKIIFILVILAVLLFSGCDAVLEVFYPELIEDFDDNNVVDIQFNVGEYYRGVLDTSGEPLQMSIFLVGSEVLGSDELPDGTINFNSSTGWGTFYFDNQNYNIWIWCDVNGNGYYDTDDFKSINPVNLNYNGTDEYYYEYKDPTDFETAPQA